MDIDSQSAGNYTYDVIGQMTGNKQDNHYFDYDVTGRVTAVYSNSATTTLIASYKYDDRGFRIKKENPQQGINTWYIRDASGNIMGVYSQPSSSGNISLKELALYGSGRIGLVQVNSANTNYVYELADHLGNVRATVQKESNGSLKLVSAADYYPFGMIMPNRATTPGEYRFGYQGQFAEKDEETGYNQFEARLYDSRIGRWLTTDPAGQFYSPYIGMGNDPIAGVDPDGRFKRKFWANLCMQLFGGDYVHQNEKTGEYAIRFSQGYWDSELDASGIIVGDRYNWPEFEASGNIVIDYGFQAKLLGKIAGIKVGAGYYESVKELRSLNFNFDIDEFKLNPDVYDGGYGPKTKEGWDVGVGIVGMGRRHHSTKDLLNFGSRESESISLPVFGTREYHYAPRLNPKTGKSSNRLVKKGNFWGAGVHGALWLGISAETKIGWYYNYK
jgi:RHS repeat-associated protein